MFAQFNSTCPCGCNSPIRSGDEIEEHDIYGWVRRGHGKIGEVCGVCFQAKAANGTCGCD